MDLTQPLKFPIIYDVFHHLCGSYAVRRRFVEEFVRATPGSRVLDIGCGSGKVIEFLPPDVEYIGYDLNRIYIEHAKKKYGERGQFFCADVNDESTRSIQGQFDFAMLVGVIHHLTNDEVHDMLKNAYNYLKPGGVLASFDNVNVSAEQPFISRWINRNDRGKYIRSPEEYIHLMYDHFSMVEFVLLTDMFIYPNYQFIMRGTK
ncbi:MAG: hypothetical protein B6242_15425 [Anaerolineaceae bacterium 4572_78]|nr:MAG: hypothetical protein B6242_15425 [Anaerolineaceae bacterium 4572_78]